jgi:hypothetical protein
VKNGLSLNALGDVVHEESPPVLHDQRNLLLIAKNLSMNETSKSNITKAAMRLRQNFSKSEASSSNITATAAPKDSFSACLLTMDDTHFLIEWLAYHYHTLPLRHLIVAVDPNSKTSPSHIFDRWRAHGMIIEEWSDRDFMNLTENDVKSNELKNSIGMTMHRIRQKEFYQKCMSKLKADNRTWTLLNDSDEYLVFNTYSKKLNVTVEKPASVMTFLHQESTKNETMLQKSPCIMIPRLRYGSKESAPEHVAKDLPKGFNGSAFQTLRFRKHAPLNSLQLNKLPKAIVDVSRVEQSEITGNVHRPANGCKFKLMRLKIPKSPLVMRHYLGTYEQFNFRDDARKADGLKTDKVRKCVSYSYANVRKFPNF